MVASATELRHAAVFWSGAWVLLDAAGALFALYFLIVVGLLVAGSVGRFNDRRRAR
ncbi:MAG: hypothetical protein JO168_14595 [Solirubrobacterales bacterium]|nr:hypothetical protein [Solirubrobacterales bacterium]MBV9717323.1 hypothetical protein [Solirubrobacterales bacterium]